MPLGKQKRAKVIDAECMGKKVSVKIPERYSGLLWAKIYDPKGVEIQFAETYFQDLEKAHGKDEDEYTDLIRTVIHNYCVNYIQRYCFNNVYHIHQSGFGGQHRNGLIDFTTGKPIRAPPTLFAINHELYTIKWEYSAGYTSDSEEEETSDSEEEETYE